MTAAQPIYLADLNRCQPSSAVSNQTHRGAWRMLPYATDTFNGTMLVAGEETAAPPVTYPLDVQGWHAISIGLYQELYFGDISIQVKLTGDPGYSVLTVKEAPLDVVYDVYWKTADLTGQQLTLAQLPGRVAQGWRADPYGTPVKVAYIRLDPLSDAEVRALQADRQEAKHRRLFAHDDTGMLTFFMREGTPAEVAREVESYRATDFARIYWEAGMGDIVSYPSTVGRAQTFEGADEAFFYVGSRLAKNAWRLMQEKGLDPLRLSCDFAHAAGLEFHPAYRPAGFYFPPPYDHFNEGSFYDRHPELRMVTQSGDVAPRLSYAFPGTRQVVLSLLREMAHYPVDGLCILYNRVPPLVGYEPPLVDGFRAEVGDDPRALDERDPRWLAYRCRVLTGFMRELRQEMDAVAQETGRTRRLGITAIVSGRDDDNLFHGMNVREWIAEGLVDTLIPFTTAPGLYSAAVSWPDMKDVAYWVGLTQGTACTLALNILPRWLSPDDYRRKAAQLYAEGVENLFFWDCYGRVNYMDQFAWNAMRRLGHKEEVLAWAQAQPATPPFSTSWVRGEDMAQIDAWMQAGQPAPGPVSVTIRQLGEWNMAYRTPG